MAETMKQLNRILSFIKSAYHGALLALISFQLSFLPNQIMAQTTSFDDINANNQALQGQLDTITNSKEATQSAEANAKIKAQSSVSKATITTDLSEQKANCTGAHQKWDDELNSCMTTEDAIQVREDYQSCAEAEDPQKCYMENAEKLSGVNSGDKYKGSKGMDIAMLVAGAYSIFLAISYLAARGAARGSKDPGGKCTSKSIFWATSLAWIAADMYLKKRAKDKFKDLSGKYEKEATNEEVKGDAGSYAAQVRAFEYLKQEQEAIKDQAKYRKMLQIGVMVGFGASAGFAAYESFTVPGWAKACKNKSVDEGSTVDTNYDANGQVIESGSSTEIASTDTSLAQGLFGKAFKGSMGSSPQILVGAGVMLAITAFLGSQADQEMSRAKDNIAEIDKVLATYSEYMAGFCPDGREDLNNARCYCYTPEGEKNEARTNSVICQNLYAADEMNYALRNEKPKGLLDGPRQGCITVTGQFDVDCKCREMKNTTTGQNACAKTPNSALISGNFGTQLGAGNAIKSMNNITNGANKGLASLNAAALGTQAAKNKKILDSILKQAAKNGKSAPSLGEFEKKAIQLMGQAGRSLQKTNPTYSGLGITRPGDSRPNNLAKAIEKAEKKVNLSNTKLAVAAGTGQVGVGAPNKGFKFDWNDNAAREGNKVQTFMDKKYDYKDNDIVERDDVSLWNVISKRYQTSGLKRLFGEDEDDE